MWRVASASAGPPPAISPSLDREALAGREGLQRLKS